MLAKTEAYLKEAVHLNKGASRTGILERWFTFWFKGFIYNQIWEDPEVDAQGLELQPGFEMLTISSGGCNVMNYLKHQPSGLHAIDLNTSHMSLTRLKLEAARRLPDYETFFRFFAEAHHPENIASYEKYLKPHLDPVTRSFWESAPKTSPWLKRIRYFEKGFYKYSKLGWLIHFSHRVARLLGSDLDRLFGCQTLEEQEVFFDEVMAPYFDNFFVKWFSQSPLAVFSLGIPPNQYQLMKEERFDGGMIADFRRRVRKLVCDFPIQENYFAWQALRGRYDLEERKALPDYLKEENFEKVREGSEMVDTHIASLKEFLVKRPAASLDKYVLLDSQDWMPKETIADLWTEIARTGKPGAKIIFRTAGCISPLETALPISLLQCFEVEKEKATLLNDQDRSAIYGMFHIYRLK